MLINNIEVQAPLVSGTNIKTINGSTLLGRGDLVVGGGGGGVSIKLRSQNWYLAGNPWFIPPSSNILNNSTAFNSGQIYFVPYFCLETVVVDQLQLRSSGATGGESKLAIYANDVNTQVPTSLIVSSAEFANTSFGYKSISITPTTLTEGNIYWFGVVGNMNMSYTTYPSNGHNLMVLQNQYNFAYYEYTGYQTYFSSYPTLLTPVNDYLASTMGNRTPFIRFRKQ